MLLADVGRERAVGALGYQPALDGLRALAIALVLWVHTGAFLDLEVAAGGGFLGVDVFFVLSGFLITTLIVERHRADGHLRWRRFYERRAVRLLPALAAYLLVHVAVARALGWDMGVELRTVAAALTYSSNWGPTLGWDLTPGQGHLWSLAIEGQFYLVWPAVMLALVAARRRVAVAALGLGIVAVLVWRMHLADRYGAGYPLVYHRTDARMDGLLVGAALGVALQGGWRPSPRSATALGVAGSVVLGGSVLAFTPQSGALYVGGFSFVALAGGALLLATLTPGGRFEALLSHPALVWLGRRSYSLYLWHLLVFVLAAYLVPGAAPVRVALAYAGSLLCAHVSYRCIERPFLQSAPRSSPIPSRRLVAPSSWPRGHVPVGAIPVVALVGLLSIGAGVGTAARHAVERRTPPTLVPEGATAPSPASPAQGRGPAGAGATGGPVVVGADPAGGPVPGAPPAAAPDAGPAPSATFRLVVQPPELVDGPAGATPRLLVSAQVHGGGAPVGERRVILRAELQPAVVGEPSVVECEATTDPDGLAACPLEVDVVVGTPLRVVATAPAAGPALPQLRAEWVGVAPAPPALAAAAVSAVNGD